MPRYSDLSGGSDAFPKFERLEDRLLLTTIHGGEFFIYQNSQHETIRLSLVGDPQDTVEVFAHRVQFGVVDLPGLLNGNANPATAIGWPGIDETITRRVWNADKTDSWYVWNNRDDQWEDPDGYTVTTQYGSEAEIYAIYVVNCSANTRLTATKLSVDPLQPFSAQGWTQMIDPWSTQTINLAFSPWYGPPQPGPDFTTSPPDSGSILVGAVHFPWDDDQMETRWVGTYYSSGEVANNVYQNGVYPGSPPYNGLPAGITVSSEVYRIANETSLGWNVLAVAANPLPEPRDPWDPTPWDEIYAVDNSPFIGRIVNTDFLTGNLGGDLHSLAVNAAGDFYGIDNERQVTVLTTGVNQGQPIPVAVNAMALAISGGRYYTVEETTGQLRCWGRFSGNNNLGFQDLGLIVAAEDTNLQYRNFIAMARHPQQAQLYGLATRSDGSDVFLVNATVPSGVRPNVGFNGVRLSTAEDSPWGPNVVPGLMAMALRIEPAGLVAYAVTGSNQLVRIDTSTGEVTLAGVNSSLGATNGLPMSTINGLEFIGDTLYAIAPDPGSPSPRLYRLDISQIDTTSAICQDLGSSMAPFAQSLAYDPNRPGRLFAIGEQSTLLRVMMVPVASSVVRISNAGTGTVLNPLWDITYRTLAYYDVNSLDFVPAGPGTPPSPAERMYAIGRIRDLDPNRATALPAAVTDSLWLMYVNTGSGEVTRIAQVSGPSDLSTVTYDPATGLFYAADPGTDRLYILDPSNVNTGSAATNLDDTLDLTGQVKLTTGDEPRSTTYGDLNADGSLDIVAVNRTGNTASVFLNDGAGGFAAQVTFATGTNPVYVLLVDLNNDGNPDLVTANQGSDNVSVRLGNGTGGFGAQSTLAVGDGPTSVYAGDVDNDNDLDLVVSNETEDTVSVLLGNGDGTFGAQTKVTTGDGPRQVVLADIDGDGNLDLVVANQNGDSVSALLGNGDGTFAQFELHAPDAVAVGDVNGDNNLDIVAANEDGDTISVLLGNGQGGFTGRLTYAVGDAPQSVRLVDVNGDSRLDAITVNRLGNSVSVLLGNGDGTFQAQAAYATGVNPSGVALGDLDGDTFPDIVTSNRNFDTVSVLLNNGNGTFAAKTDYAVGDTPAGVALADVNVDGALDIISVNQFDDTVSVLLGRGDGTFDPQTAFNVWPGTTSPAQPFSPVAVAVADLDGDGAPDIVTANRNNDTVSVLLGSGDGGFATQGTFSAGDGPQAVTIGFANRDATPDVIVANLTANTVAILLGNGDGTLRTAVASPVGRNPRGVAVGDFDEDGNLDVVAANRSDDSLSVLTGNGNGTLDPATTWFLGNTFGVGDGPRAVATVDLDGDGNLDVVSANANDGTVSVLLGDGTGSFAPEDSYTIGLSPESVFIGDLNGDGDADVITACSGSDTISARFGNGNGTLGRLLNYQVGDTPTSAFLADLNNDGFDDAVAANSAEDTLSVLLGNGNGSFGGTTRFTGNDGPIVGLEWVPLGTEQVLLGVTPTTLYVIDPITGTCTELGPITRYDPLVGPDTANLTSLAYDPYSDFWERPEREGYLWSIDDYSTYYYVDNDNNQVYVPFSSVEYRDGLPFLTGTNTPIIKESNYRLTRIPLGATLMFSNGLTVREDGVLWDRDEVNHPLWFYDNVTAMDYSPDGTLYGVATVRSLDPINDPVPVDTTYLVTIAPPVADPYFGIYGNTVRLVTQIAALSVDNVSTIAFAETGTLYGVNWDTREMFTFDTPGGGAYDGNVTVVGALPARVTGLDFQVDYISWLPGYGDATFGQQMTFAVSDGPTLAQPRDRNGDGILDFVTANEFQNTVSVILRGVYDNPLVYRVGQAPVDVATANLDRQLGIDIVTANRDGNSVTILFGDTDGTVLGMEYAPQAIAMGDFNGDGYLDMAVANGESNYWWWAVAADSVTILLGNQYGQFQASSWVQVGYSPSDVVAEDLNADGFLDLVVTNSMDYTVSVVMGRGNGTFDPQVVYDVGFTPMAASVGDLNGDLAPDIVTANYYSDDVSILLNNGDGTYAAAVSVGVGFYPVDVATADVDNDLILDIVVVSDWSNAMTVLLGNGDGTFGGMVLSGGTYSADAIALGDVNNDGDLDVVLANGFYDTVTVRLGGGDGSFGAETTFATGMGTTRVSLGDLNDDGNLDIVAANEYSNTLSVLLGDGAGNFAAAVSYTAGNNPRPTVLADVTGDGFLDVIVGNYYDYNISVLAGRGDGTLSPQATFANEIIGTDYQVGDQPVDVVLADVNRDTYPDILTANFGGDSISVLWNDGLGGFPIQIAYDTGDEPTSLATGDINSDGILDVIVTNSGDNTIWVRMGDWNGLFGAETVYQVGDKPMSVALGDFNNDGFLDVVVANEDGLTVSVLMGLGNGTLAVHREYTLGYGPRSVAVGDINGDGSLDIVTANETSNSVSILRGKGDGTFMAQTSYPMEYGPRTVRLADVDGDGILDIMTANADQHLYGASPYQLYSINRDTAGGTAVSGVGLSGTYTGLGDNPLDADYMWGVASFNNGNADNYFLTRVYTSTAKAVQDMDRIVIGGTVAGQITTAGNLGVIRLGYLWGDITVGKNLDTLILRQGGGTRILGPNTVLFPATSFINVQGTLNRLETRGSHFGSSVNVHNDSAVVPLSHLNAELEHNAEQYINPLAAYRSLWIQGELMHYGGVPWQTWEDNTTDHAMYLNHPSGSVILEGEIAGEVTSTLPEPVPVWGDQWLVDYYTIALTAGQTITVQGWIILMGGLYPFIEFGITASPLMSPKLHLYDAEGNWVDSLGYETVDDYGIGSQYRYDSENWIDEQKPMVFTAPKAGVYRLAVVSGTLSDGWAYHIELDGLMPAALGAISVDGDVAGGPLPVIPRVMNGYVPTDDQGRFLSLTMDDIMVLNGGSIGAVMVRGTLGVDYTTLSRPVIIHTIGGGDVGAIEAGQVVVTTLYSEGHIGSLTSTSGELSIVAVAGFVGLDPATGLRHPFPYDNNAFIHNIRSAGLMGGSFQATGSIGTIDSVGNIAPAIIEVNSDQNGPEGHIDLIVGEAGWGDPLLGVPLLMRHRDGDIGFIHIAGEVLQDFGEWIGPASEHIISNGASETIYDDSGGRLVITPVVTVEVDANGEPLYTTDAQGNQVIRTHVPAYSYIVIGVDDFYNPGSGDGGVICKIVSTGSISFNATGDVKISQLTLDASGIGFNTPLTVSGSGSGPLHFYNIDSATDWNSIVNSTKGDIISGSFQSIGTVRTGGSIGAIVKKMGNWVHGLYDAPVVAPIMLLEEPQYGWYDSKVNGLMINGSVNEVIAGGAIRDVRATGVIGRVVANSDRQAPGDAWDGICGIVWSGVRINSIELGDGLADDGPVAKAKAAVMSGGSIGSVTIAGPRYVRNGVVYGEINGSILAFSNDYRDPLVEYDAVGSITGTNGAQITAIVGGIGLDSFYCFSSSVMFLTGTLLGGNFRYSGVGNISFSGSHALIHGAEIVGNYVRSVVATTESDGIVNTSIAGDRAQPNSYSVGRVAAGGPGMSHVFVSADGGDIGTLEGLGSVADIYFCQFVVTDGGIYRIRARDVYESTIHSPGPVGSISFSRDMINVATADGVFDYVSVLTGDGTGMLDTAVRELTETWPLAVAMRDLNSDGLLDIVTINEHNDFHTVNILMGLGFGMYGFPVTYTVEAMPRGLALGDVDNDGDYDIVVASAKEGRISVLLNDGDGLFERRKVYQAGTGAVAVALGDVNNDRVLDIIVANQFGNNVSVLLGRGNGTFRAQTKYSVGASPMSVAVADLDGDGNVDIVTANADDDTVSVLTGRGDGRFVPQVTYATGEYPRDVALGDLDNDGDVDIAVVNQHESVASILLNNGDGTFADQTKVNIGHGSRAIALGDMDADGNLDVVTVNQADNNVSVLLGNGDGTFQTQRTQDAPENPVDVALGDTDNDGYLDVVTANKGTLIPGLLIGAVQTLAVGRNIVDNYQKVAGTIGRMTVGGAFINTELLLPGSAANLKYFQVEGDISGVIESHGQIGSIISRNGAIFADIYTTADVGAESNDVYLIRTARGFGGRLSIAGSLARFECYTSLGNDPRAGGEYQGFRIYGDLGTLRVRGTRTEPAHLFADLNVGGNVNVMDIDGTLFGDVSVHGNLNKLTLDGHLGYIDPVTAQAYGSLDVYGKVNYLRFAKEGDLVADVITGGSIKQISIRNGSILGDITSRYGEILGVSVTNGSILGNITGKSIRNVSVTNGNIGPAPTVADPDPTPTNIVATGGDIRSVTVRNGDLLANVAAASGRINKVAATYGNLGRSDRKLSITAMSGIGQVSATSSRGVDNGHLHADIEAGGTFDVLNIRGSVNPNFAVLGRLNISADAGVKRATVRGDVSDTTLRGGGKIDRFDIYGDLAEGSTISSGWNIGTGIVRGNVIASGIYAGYDVGADGLMGTADDNPFNLGNPLVPGDPNSRNVAHSGDINSLTVRGQMLGSVVTAGVDPGANNVFLDAPGSEDNTEAPGSSTIRRMTVSQGFAGGGFTADRSAIFADTAIQQKFLLSARIAGATVPDDADFISNELDGLGVDFGPDIGRAQQTLPVSPELTITLRGDGRANYDDTTGILTLERTTSRSSLDIRYTGDAVYPLAINIVGSEDSALSSIRLRGNIMLGDVDVDGPMRTMNLTQVEDAATWNLPGGAGTVRFNDRTAEVTDLNVVAGQINSWTMSNAFVSGDVMADAIRTMRLAAPADGTTLNLTSRLGEVRSLRVDGDYLGDIDVFSSVGTADFRGSFAGGMTIHREGMGTMKVAQSFTGQVNVLCGDVNTVTIYQGDFGTTEPGDETTFRAQGQIKRLTVTRGDFHGLLSTEGDLLAISVRRGDVTGRIRSGGSVRTAQFGSMTGGLAAAAGDFQRLTIYGDMLGSSVYAGFDPGDDPDGLFAYNAQIDALTPVHVRTAGNADRAYGGDIKTVVVQGSMSPKYDAIFSTFYGPGSTISAAVSPGKDGFCGTYDDVVRGTGTVGRVTVYGGIFGNGITSQSFGVFAAGNMPTVYFWRNRLFVQNDNVSAGSVPSTVGNLLVRSVTPQLRTLIVNFNHAINFGTINTRQIETSEPTTFHVYASNTPFIDFNGDGHYDNFTGMEPDISDIVANKIEWDPHYFTATMTLLGRSAWNNLAEGNYFLLVIDGGTVADPYGTLLDGNADGNPGGNFEFAFAAM